MSGFSDVLSTVGSAVGAAIGGPVGGVVGGAVGDFAGDAIDGEVTASNPPMATASASSGGGVWGSAPPTSQQWPGGMSTNGKDTIDTGRYLISFKDGEATIYDKQNNTSVRAWGDPHLHTSDGDKAQFHQNLTIDLPDGTKVSFKTTPPDENGISLIDSVAVMKGSQAVLVNGLTGSDGFDMGSVLNNADAVDAMWGDGTVLRAGSQVDDLTFAGTGEEIIGTDPTQPWNEIMLDGQGGQSIVRPEGAANPTEAVDPAAPASEGVAKGGSLYDILWAIIAKLENSIQGRADTVAKLSDEFDKQQDLMAKNGGELPPNYKLPDELKGYVGDGGNQISETTMKKALADIQRLQEMVGQLTTTMTNIQKADHEAKMAVATNIK